MDLKTAAAELRAYVADHMFDLFEGPLLRPREEGRIFEHHGVRYQVMFTHIKPLHGPMVTRRMYLLSIKKPDAPAGQAQVPDAEEGDEIAREFFPGGFSSVPEVLDAANLSRKYYALE